MLESRIGDAARTVLRPVRSTMISRCRDIWSSLAATALANSAIAGRAVAGEIRHRNIRLAERYPAVRGQAVMGHSAMPLTGVGSGDSQGADWTAAKDGCSVDGLAGIDPRESPAGAGAEVSRPLAHDDQFCAERESSGEKTGVQGHCLQVAAECLSDGHSSRKQAAGPQLRHRAGERHRQCALVAHHVDNPGAGAVVCDGEQYGNGAECKSATITGIPSIESASASSSWCAEPCSSAPATMACNGR